MMIGMSGHRSEKINGIFLLEKNMLLNSIFVILYVSVNVGGVGRG